MEDTRKLNYTELNSQASMEDMRLSHARFVGCDYGGISLADSWLTHAQLSGEVPRRPACTCSPLARGSSLDTPGDSLRPQVLDGANLDHARLMHANLTGASLVNTASGA